jgi:hypothetical protein
MKSQINYMIVEEAFACSREPQVFTFGDGTQAMLTNWMTSDAGDITLMRTAGLVQKLTRYKDDLGAWHYSMTEYNPEEYEQWLCECVEAHDALPAPPSYHDDIDVPDFIGAELWERRTQFPLVGTLAGRRRA